METNDSLFVDVVLVKNRCAFSTDINHPENIFLTSVFSSLQTDALFKYSGVENTSGTLIEMIISIAITYPIILFILAKKYNWTNWKEKLTGRVTQPDSIINE